MEILHLQGERYPAFGPLAAINVDLEVTEVTPGGFRALGSVRESKSIRLHIIGKKRADLSEG